MIKKELFDKTVSILVKAFMNGTLEKGNDCACAVGNLVSSAFGYSFNEEIKWNNETPRWFYALLNFRDKSHVGPSDYGMDQIEKTGYSIEAIDKIEKAFESVYPWPHNTSYNSSSHQYRCLMAVIDVLQEIHECTKEETEQAKLLFVK